MKVFDGREIQKKLLLGIKQRLQKINYQPVLAVIWVGDDPVSARYVAIKCRIAENLGIRFDISKYSPEVNQDEVLERIGELNSLSDGLMVQLPLPANWDRQKIIAEINPAKDVDGLRVCANLQSEIRPPVVKAIFRALDQAKVNLPKAKVAVIGSGFLVGAPLVKSLDNLVADLRVAEINTPDIKTLTADADVVISAVGKSGLITPDLVKEGVVLIDAGTSEIGGEIKGDIDPETYKKASFYTPVPGGIGPVTVAELFANLLNIVEKRRKRKST